MNTDYKSDVLKNIQLELSTKFIDKDVKTIMSILTINLNDFDLMSKKYEVIEYAGEKNEGIIKKIVVCKKLEGLTDTSLKYYGLVLKKFIKTVTKDLTIVNTDDVRYFLAVEMQRGKNSDISLDSMRRVLNSFYGWMVQEEIIGKNPVLKIKKMKITKTVKEPFSSIDIEKMRNACDTQREKAIFEVLLSSGARRAELATASRDNFSAEKGEILIMGKGKKERKLLLSTKAIYELNKYLEERTDDFPCLFLPERIIKNKKDCFISYTSLDKAVKKIGKKAGVENVHLHRFRRTAATIALKRGMPIEQVQRLLGHNQIDTTLIYAKIDQEDFKNNYRKIMS